MNNILKAVLFISPVIFLIFFYVVSQQSKNDVEMKKADAQFEQKWNEFDKDFTHDPAQKKVYDERAEVASKKIADLEKKEAEAQAKSDKMQQEMEKQMEDPENQKELERRTR